MSHLPCNKGLNHFGFRQDINNVFCFQVQPFGDPVNSVKDEVKYEMQENANMAKGTGVPVSQNMVPAAGVGTHQPHTGQASGSLKTLCFRL